ncbi:hypothetical protein F442_23225 [Phytophthora nicotianae P10297]|uniref:Uncharacterized protein n=2 Tax=Phytophthora nicotianae TaxID=4792 RepID=W2XZX5_PHYNI|nr:hypothetical protein F442_23225 [Phytophthora nicotianae P10297]
MVHTRAQAAAAAVAAAHMSEMPDVETAIVPHVERASTAPLAIANVPSVADHLANLAQHSIAQTQALAAEHVALQQQHQGHSHAQNAALMAMQATTESSVTQLADQQRAIVEELGEALTATQSRLQDQQQHLQMVQDVRGGQIERFVNDSIAHAQEEAQREAQIAASAHLEGVRQKLLEMEAKIDGGLENISQHVQQLVEDSFAASQLQVDSCEESTRAVQMEVEAAATRIKASLKESLELDLQRASGAVRQDLLARVSSAEEPLRESIRSLVLDITTNAAHLLECRVHKAHTNTQSELNLQVQRQADATTALREQIRKLNVQAKRQARKSDGAALETTVADLVRQEVEERFRGVQINAQRKSDANIKFRQEVQTQIRDYQSNSDRSIQAAVGEICKTIRDAVRAATQETEELKRDGLTQQVYGSDELNDGGDGDEPAADEDPALEKRMQEA